jgi:hypothetical protein
MNDDDMRQMCFLGLAAAMVVVAAPSLAQTRPIHSQIQQINAAERVQLLRALTPVHKALLADLEGTLAISEDPDVAGAVRQLNAALSPAERQAILNAAQSAEANKLSLTQGMHPQLGAGGLEARTGQAGVPRGPRTDAGLVLLRHAVPNMGFANTAGNPPQ